MAKISTNVHDGVYSIKKWLGVNEAQEGEASLKFGEAAVCRNFRVTSGGALQKRPGSRNVAGLMTGYDVVVDAGLTTLRTEYAASTASYPMYPRAMANSVGAAEPDGTPVTVNYGNRESYTGYFYPQDGALYQFVDCVRTERQQVSSGKRGYAGTGGYQGPASLHPWFVQFTSLSWTGTSWSYSGAQVVNTPTDGKYTVLDSNGWPVTLWRGFDNVYRPGLYEFDLYQNPGMIGRFDGMDPDSITYWDITIDRWFYMCLMVSVWREATIAWRFHPTHTQSNTAGTRVRGIWSGFVGGREVLCAACNGHLWELEHRANGWTKTSCGLLDADHDVHLFGFDEKLYILNGQRYMVWNGVTLSDVEGYRPIVTVSTAPTGGGTELERVNLLTGAKRSRFSPDGSSTVFQLPETGITSVDWVKNLATGANLSYSVNAAAGKVTISPAPAAGVNTVEIAWTKGSGQRSKISRMRFAELYNGVQDTRVFVYGDGSNVARYSGLDYDGKARADYFPDLNEAAVGDENTPITGMIRHYDRLLCFKLDSAWTIRYDTITLPEGTVTAGFYVSPLNRDVGNCAPGQACLVENRPRTLDGRSVIEWRATGSSGQVTGDQRNAQRVSQRVERTIRTFDLTTARTFYDKITHEYYVIGEGGEALVHNVEADAWYTYTDFKAACLINYKDEVYYGTVDGYLRHFSTEYLSDEGETIDAYWESGAMDFNADHRRKYSAMLWIGIRPEEAGYLAVSAETDRKNDFTEYSFATYDARAVPTMEKVRLKAKKFTYYKLVLRSDAPETTATVVSADLRIRAMGYVR